MSLSSKTGRTMFTGSESRNLHTIATWSPLFAQRAAALTPMWRSTQMRMSRPRNAAQQGCLDRASKCFL